MFIMLEKSFGLLFYLKQSKNEKKQSVIYKYLRSTVNGLSNVSLYQTPKPGGRLSRITIKMTSLL
jgi:hypothetical protein